MNPVTFIIGSLAVWRLSHALVRENGPLMVFARLRARFARKQKRSGGMFDLISCVYCTSFWIGLVAALWVAQDVFRWIGYGLAFSAVATLLEALFAKYADTLAIVARPARDDKVLVRGSTAPEKRDNMVGNPHTLNG